LTASATDSDIFRQQKLLTNQKSQKNGGGYDRPTIKNGNYSGKDYSTNSFAVCKNEYITLPNLYVKPNSEVKSPIVAD
uniref:Uncharacterized protein n=1 Tax=Romanomermis culicivorax TaxID=13658 RepID=A0A915LD27_ROMCU